MNDLLVMKFGGTSVGSAERMRVAAGLAAGGARTAARWRSWSRPCRRSPTCCSDTMRHAEAGDRAGMDANLAALRSRHEDACRELLPEPRQRGRAGADRTS